MIDRRRLKPVMISALAGLIFGLITIVISQLAVQYDLLRAAAILILSLNSGATIIGYQAGLPIGSSISTYLPPLLYWALVGLLTGFVRRARSKVLVVIVTLVVSLALFIFAEFHFHPG